MSGSCKYFKYIFNNHDFLFMEGEISSFRNKLCDHFQIFFYYPESMTFNEKKLEGWNINQISVCLDLSGQNIIIIQSKKIAYLSRMLLLKSSTKGKMWHKVSF